MKSPYTSMNVWTEGFTRDAGEWRGRRSPEC